MSVKKRKSFIIGFGLLVCIGLSCGILFWPEQVPPPPSEFDQIGCKKPCWHNLQVGVSTRQDVQEVLDALTRDANQIQIEDGKYSSGDFIRIDFQDGTRSASFYFEDDGDDVVNRIYLTNMLIMSQALEVFGDPDGVLLTSRPTIHPNYWKKSIQLYYSKKGLTIGCYEGTTLWNTDGSPCSEINDVTLGFFDPSYYRELLMMEYGDADLALEYMRPYTGLSADYPVFVATPTP